jgi:hypothetical protein
MKMKHHPAIMCLFLVVGIVLSSEQSMVAQGVGLPVPKSRQPSHMTWVDIREYKNAAGEVLAKGTFDKLENGRVFILVGREPIRVLLTELSEEDQSYVRAMIENKKKREHADKVILETMPRLDISRQIEIHRGCRKLKTLGRFGSPASNNVLQLIGASTEASVKHELLLTYLEICEVNEGSIRNVFQLFDSPSNRDLLARIENNPRPFFQSYAKLGEDGLEYLQFVAFRGRLLSNDNPPIAPTSPEEILDDDSTALQRRAQACEAIGRIQSVESMGAILKLLAHAEQASPVEESTIRACINAFASLRMKDDEINEALNRHADRFPELVARARERISRGFVEGETDDDAETTEETSDGG